MVETARSYEIPDFDSLPEGSEVVVELYGGAVSYRLDGKKRRVYVTRFDWIPFSSESSARQAFLDLWETLRGLDSVAAVEKAAHAWAKRVRSQPAAC
jgi:hypothetical protein